MRILNNKDRVQSVEKAADLLYCFLNHRKELSLKELVELTGWKRTTIYRILNSLVIKGFVNKNHSTGTYSLGLTFLNFGALVSERLDLREKAMKTMKELSASTNETISLNIIEDQCRVCIEKIDSQNMVRHHISIGQFYSLLKGASGKTLLAYSSQRFLHEYYCSKEILSLNKTKLSELENELNIIRNQGYGFSKDERVKGAFAVSAPIFFHDGELAGGLTISGLSSTMNEEKKSYYISQLKKAVQIISKNMGSQN